MSLYWICLCCFYRLKTAENGLNGHFILNHKALRQVYGITKGGYDLTSPSVSPYELSTPSFGGEFNMFVLNDDIDSADDLLARRG